jgi:hypothetical protein
MRRRSGTKLVLPLSEFERRIQASLERKLRLFGSDGRPPGLYGIGPRRELIGRPLRGLTRTRAPVRAKIEGADAFSAVDLRSEYVPAQLTGHVLGEQASRVRDLAAALNGRIVAVGQTFSLGGGTGESFSIILPEGAFRNGRNRVELLSVSGTGPGLRFESLGSAG